MNTKLSILVSFILVLCSACTDVIDITEGSKKDEMLVVEGEITDEPGPYSVKLSTTSSTDGLGINTLGEGAKVVIESSSGEEEVLNEIGNGIYVTKSGGIKGEIGESYRVNITLLNGNQYQSDFEEIPEKVQISSLGTELIDETQEDSDGVPRRRLGHLLSAELIKQPNKDQFFRVEVEGILEAEVDFVDIGCVVPVPPISICYATRNPLANQIRVSSNANISKELYIVDIVAIPVEQRRKYLAKVIVRSFSDKTFLFWSTVSDQLERNGSIFDSPIPPVIGNIRNLSDGELAQGYFTASSTSRDQICIDRSNIIAAIPPALACSMTCVEVWTPATLDRTEFSFCD